MAVIAAGLAHPRRIAVVQTLQEAPRRLYGLRTLLDIPSGTMSHHLAILRESGWIQLQQGILTSRPPDHPLARALARLAAAE